MFAYALQAYGRRFVGISRPPQTEITKGWRPHRWVKDPELAELFSSDAAARAYGAGHLGHTEFSVITVVPRTPVPPYGGSAGGGQVHLYERIAA